MSVNLGKHANSLYVRRKQAEAERDAALEALRFYMRVAPGQVAPCDQYLVQAAYGKV